MMRSVVVLAVLLAGCGAPSDEDCKEFDHLTAHDGKPVKCRMVWCETGEGFSGFHRSGVAALWCDPHVVRP